jgi:SAM-dependent methyltransferase
MRSAGDLPVSVYTQKRTMPETPTHRRPFIAEVCVCCASTDLARSPAVLMPVVAHRAFGWTPVEIDESWGLNTISSGHAYSLCNSLQCQACGHLFLDIRFTDDQLSRIYQDYFGPEYCRLRESYEPGYTARNAAFLQVIPYMPAVEDFLRDLVPPMPSILDWGGGRGLNTPFRGANRWHHVLDISNQQPVSGAQIVAPDQVRAGQYDLVVCANVIEHIPYPLDLLQQVAASLGPDSILYLELPYERILSESDDDRSAYRRKRHWHEHINFYSRQSLKALLVRSGLTAVRSEMVNARPLGEPSYNFMLACRLTPNAALEATA